MAVYEWRLYPQFKSLRTAFAPYQAELPSWWSQWRPEATTRITTYHAYLDPFDQQATGESFQQLQEIQRGLAQYDPQSISEQITHITFTQWAQAQLADYPFRYHNYILSPIDGAHLQLMDLLTMYHPFRNQEDGTHYLQRIRAIPQLCKSWEAHLNQQIESDIIPPRPVLKASRDQLMTWARMPAREHLLYLTFARKASQMDMVDMNEYMALDLLTKIDESLTQEVQPAFEQVAQLVDSMMKRADTTWGVYALPKGESYYVHRLKQYSALQLSPYALYQWAQEQLHQCEADIWQYADSMGIQAEGLAALFSQVDIPPVSDSLGAYLQTLRSAQRTQRTYSGGLMDSMTVRRLGLHVRLDSQQAAPRYFAGDLGGSRAGVLRLPETPSTPPPLLLYQWIDPGMHTFMSRHLYAGDRLDFRRSLVSPIATAGWRLYALYLIDHDLGILRADPALHLQYEALRLAHYAKLVVDLGLHSQKWSKEEADAFLATHTLLSPSIRARVLLEVLSQPGQAAAAVTGFSHVLALRQQARQTLGDAFYLQGFHDAILFEGAVPPEAQSLAIREWIARTGESTP